MKQFVLLVAVSLAAASSASAKVNQSRNLASAPPEDQRRGRNSEFASNEKNWKDVSSEKLVRKYCGKYENLEVYTHTKNGNVIISARYAGHSDDSTKPHHVCRGSIADTQAANFKSLVGSNKGEVTVVLESLTSYFHGGVTSDAEILFFGPDFATLTAKGEVSGYHSCEE